jgi:hypothetical protein
LHDGSAGFQSCFSEINNQFDFSTFTLGATPAKHSGIMNMPAKEHYKLAIGSFAST